MGAMSRSIAVRRRAEAAALRRIEQHSSPAVARGASIAAATRAGRAALAARRRADVRLLSALNRHLEEELSIRQAADRVGVSYSEARRLLRRPCDADRLPSPR